MALQRVGLNLIYYVFECLEALENITQRTDFGSYLDKGSLWSKFKTTYLPILNLDTEVAWTMEGRHDPSSPRTRPKTNPFPSFLISRLTFDRSTGVRSTYFIVDSAIPKSPIEVRERKVDAPEQLGKQVKEGDLKLAVNAQEPPSPPPREGSDEVGVDNQRAPASGNHQIGTPGREGFPSE
ncbi:uncharacterized protein N7515_001571 [Penicillium bovifimosum]|uniref:Uncharacterized protein n=1 Tax=Penicillium bovifimosum TaxID=126998 RepID=A0A9W9L8U6_9EURO|nr:uncharacterized protein N7515_001571 [Penicillium bovifimosum]KAJ5142784.1 hypothetical protein N7515_001571 [Penicillium bovifimosum]